MKTSDSSLDMPPCELTTTADGSHTLFVPEMNEHYHSTNGAIQEALHVYIQAGLLHVARTEVRLLEIGFGTGLNALLTWAEAEAQKLPITYYSIERFPLSTTVLSQLNYGKRINSEVDYTKQFQQLHTAAWNTPIVLSPYFTLHKIKGDSNTIDLPNDLDVIYFDAFGPDKQPEMWNQAIFDKLFQRTRPGGILTTYCAKGVVRRMMQQAGYTMERIPGPPGKREMLRATASNTKTQT